MIQRIRSILHRNNILAISANGLGAVIGFINFMLLTRSMPKADFGQWMIFLTTATFLDMIRTGLLQTPMVRFLSGAGKQVENEIRGSAWVLGLGITLFLAGFVCLAGFIFQPWIETSSFTQFFRWYPVLALCALPHSFSGWLLQARQHFGRLLFQRMALRITFLIFLILNFFWLHTDTHVIVQAYVASHFLLSIFVLMSGWSGIDTIRAASRVSIRKLFDFGKYSVGTLIGSNLLKSSDTMIIGWLLGPVAVAAYNVPLKLVELIEIPLRGFASVSLPEFSRYSQNNDNDSLKQAFQRYVSTLTMLVIPALTLVFIFAEPLVVLLGGEAYRDSAIILRIFTLYCFFLPFDRYSGITFDSINRPDLNFYKVLAMVTANIMGDIVAIYIFHANWAVAGVTIFTFLVGALVSHILLNRHLGPIPWVKTMKVRGGRS